MKYNNTFPDLRQLPGDLGGLEPSQKLLRLGRMAPAD